MNFLEQFEQKTADLHSETISVIRRQINDSPFDIAVTNGRTRVWAERFHEIEPEFLSWCEVLDFDDVLWDLGASIGHFSIYAALVSGARVYAFEPEAQNFSHCALNHFLNHKQLDGQFIPLNFGVADKNSLEDMHIRLYGAGEHTKTLVPGEASFNTKILLLRMETILELGVSKPTAVKIDVDGSEHIVVEALAAVWPSVDHLFMELPKAEIGFFSSYFSKHGLEKTGEFQVVKMSGGFYEDIVNVTFSRSASNWQKSGQHSPKPFMSL